MNYEGKSCVGMLSCVKVLCITTTHKENFKKRDLILLLLFQLKQLRGAVAMALNPLYRIYLIKNSSLFC